MLGCEGVERAGEGGRGKTFVKLMEALVESALLYGAEVNAGKL